MDKQVKNNCHLSRFDYFETDRNISFRYKVQWWREPELKCVLRITKIFHLLLDDFEVEAGIDVFFGLVPFLKRNEFDEIALGNKEKYGIEKGREKTFDQIFNFYDVVSIWPLEGVGSLDNEKIGLDFSIVSEWSGLDVIDIETKDIKTLIDHLLENNSLLNT